MIDVSEHPQGAVLAVRAQPGARKNCLRGEQSGALRVAVTQVAEKGKANEAVVEVLAEALGLKRSQIELLAGPAQRDKRFLIRGMTRDALVQRIEAALAE